MAFASAMPSREFLWNVFQRYYNDVNKFEGVIFKTNSYYLAWIETEVEVYLQMNYKLPYLMEHGVLSIRKQSD